MPIFDFNTSPISTKSENANFRGTLFHSRNLSEAVDAILPSKNIIDRFLRAGKLLALASLFMISSRMTPRACHFGSYLHYDKNMI